MIIDTFFFWSVKNPFRRPCNDKYEKKPFRICNGIQWERICCVWIDIIVTSIPKSINKKCKWKKVTKVETSLKQIVQRNQLWFAWIPAQWMAWRVKDEFRHGLLYIWTELLSIFFSSSAHMRLKFGTKITTRECIFLTRTFLI